MMVLKKIWNVIKIWNDCRKITNDKIIDDLIFETIETTAKLQH